MLEESLSSQITNAVTELERGGVVLFPADCGWAIGCDATNEQAVARLLSIVNVKDAIFITLLVASEKDILNMVTQPDLEVFNFLDVQTQPTSILYQDVIGIADLLLQPNGEIAIRITHDLLSRSLIKRLQSSIAIHPIKLDAANFIFPTDFEGAIASVYECVDFTISMDKKYAKSETEVNLYRFQPTGILSLVF